MDILSFLASLLYAFEAFVVPIPESTPMLNYSGDQPKTTFGRLLKEKVSEVLGTDTTQPSPTPTESAPKKSFIIAVLGDSMIDTLGIGIPPLQKALSEAYPDYSFTIYNYGVGATDIEYGIQRMLNPYIYKDKKMPALIESRADIVVIESFAYNPFPYIDGALERHWGALGKLVDLLSKRLPKAKVVIAATIAPNEATFGDGSGYQFDPGIKRFKTYEIKVYLDNALKFAKFHGYPIADAYSESVTADGDGKLEYISTKDHIHPSDAGAKLFSQKVADAIIQNNLIK